MTDPQALQDFPRQRVWAVVGVSADREKYGNIIYRDLKASGYTVYPVNPKLKDVEGDVCYADLASLPQVPDVVNVVVPPAATSSVVEACIALGIKRIWFQPGSESEAAIAKAELAGIVVVANACIMLEKVPV